MFVWSAGCIRGTVLTLEMHGRCFRRYIRGSTLRFLCKLKEPMLLEPLMPSIQENLSNRHAYVRRLSDAVFSLPLYSAPLCM